MKNDAKDSRDDESDDKAEQPRASGVDSQITKVTAEKVDRTVRQIDVSHEAKNQGEAAGDEEIEAAQRDPVQHGVEEELLSAEDRLEARGPGGEHEPNRRNHQNCDDQGPDRTARDELVHRRPFERDRQIVENVAATLSSGRVVVNSPVTAKQNLP